MCTWSGQRCNHKSKWKTHKNFYILIVPCNRHDHVSCFTGFRTCRTLNICWNRCFLYYIRSSVLLDGQKFQDNDNTTQKDIPDKRWWFYILNKNRSCANRNGQLGKHTPMCFSNSEEILSYQRILYHLRCSHASGTLVPRWLLFLYSSSGSCRNKLNRGDVNGN